MIQDYFIEPKLKLENEYIKYDQKRLILKYQIRELKISIHIMI